MLVRYKNCGMLAVLLVFLCVVGLAEPVRHDVNEMMYVNIPGGSACFRRLNGTHQFGCSSPFGGAYGVIHVLNDSTDLDEFVKNAVAGPYVVVLRPLLFSKSTVDALIKSGQVNGVLLAWTPSSTKPENYSPDDTCPNRNEGYCDSSSPWNPDGFGFFVSDIPFPIFVVQDEPHVLLINQCFKDFNAPLDSSQLSKPLCMLQLKSHMFGAVNSEVCTRRLVFQMMSVFKYCDPLGSENIVYPMLNHTDTVDRKLIAVIARLDGASIFDGFGPGAMSAVSGSATLIILASVINQLKSQIETHKRYKGVIFMLLNGESFDYIGSQRIVYDMEQGTFMSPNNKISLEDIGMVVELSQLGPGKTFYVHRTGDNQATEFADALLDLPKKLNLSVEFKLSSLSSNKLPPVSLNTFVRANPNVTGIVISNYDTSFTNRYYNSIYDNATNMNYVNSTGQFDGSVPPKGSVQYNLGSAAIVLARAIAKAVNQDDSIIYDIVPSRVVQSMDDVLYCYLGSRKCKLFQKLYPALAANTPGPEVMSLYVGIPTSVSHMTRATSRVFAYLASPREEMSQDNCTAKCSDDELCFWVQDKDKTGECVISPARLLLAVSPAFDSDNYNWSSGKYSTWTESVWSETSLRLFIQGNSQKEIVVFISGLASFVVSFLLVFFINRKSKSLFSPGLQPQNC